MIKGGWGRYYSTRETDDIFMIAQNILGIDQLPVARSQRQQRLGYR